MDPYHCPACGVYFTDCACDVPDQTPPRLGCGFLDCERDFADDDLPDTDVLEEEPCSVCGIPHPCKCLEDEYDNIPF